MVNGNRYRVTETTKELYGEIFTTYGIMSESCSFDDISTDKAYVLSLAERLNREEVEECHFMYIIEDTLDK